MPSKGKRTIGSVLVLLIFFVAIACTPAKAGTFPGDPDLLKKLQDGKYDQIANDDTARADLYCVLKVLTLNDWHLANGPADIGYSDADAFQGVRYWIDPKLFALITWPTEDNALAMSALIDQKGIDSVEVNQIGSHLLKLATQRGIELAKTSPSRMTYTDSGGVDLNAQPMKDADFQKQVELPRGPQSADSMAIEHTLKSRLVQSFPEPEVRTASDLIEQAINKSDLAPQFKPRWLGTGERRILLFYNVLDAASTSSVLDSHNREADKRLYCAIIASMPNRMLSFAPELFASQLPKGNPVFDPTNDPYRGPGALISVLHYTAYKTVRANTNNSDAILSTMPAAIQGGNVLVCEYSTDFYNRTRTHFFWAGQAPPGWDAYRKTMSEDNPLNLMLPAVDKPPFRDPVPTEEEATHSLAKMLSGKNSTIAGQPTAATQPSQAPVGEAAPRSYRRGESRPSPRAKPVAPRSAVSPQTAEPTPAPVPATTALPAPTPALAQAPAAAPGAAPVRKAPTAKPTPGLGDLSVKTAPGFTYAYFSSPTTIATFGDSFATLTQKAIAALQNGNLSVNGPCVVTVRGFTTVPDQTYTLEVGYVISSENRSKLPAGMLQARIAPYQCASVTSTGPMKQVLDAYTKIAGELPARHLTAATNVSRQIYNKFENPDSPNNQIEVQVEVVSEGQK